jgi:hypothetical protein
MVGYDLQFLLKNLGFQNFPSKAILGNWAGVFMYESNGYVPIIYLFTFPKADCKDAPSKAVEVINGEMAEREP